MDKEKALSAGGKFWEKNGIERVYLNGDACKNLIGASSYTVMEEQSLKKARTFYCVKTGQLRSDVGTVRVMFNRENIDCVK